MSRIQRQQQKGTSLKALQDSQLVLVRQRQRRRTMRKFDPWPIFFKREWNRNWPFLVGFAITGALITKFSLSLTEEDAKKSPFVQRHKR